MRVVSHKCSVFAKGTSIHHSQNKRTDHQASRLHFATQLFERSFVASPAATLAVTFCWMSPNTSACNLSASRPSGVIRASSASNCLVANSALAELLSNQQTETRGEGCPHCCSFTSFVVGLADLQTSGGKAFCKRTWTDKDMVKVGRFGCMRPLPSVVYVSKIANEENAIS